MGQFSRQLVCESLKLITCSFGDTHRNKSSSSEFAFTSLRDALHHCRQVLPSDLSCGSFIRMFGYSPSCLATLLLSCVWQRCRKQRFLVSYKYRPLLILASRDRSSPTGYKLSVIPFSGGEPVAAPNNDTATIDILTNADNSVCPNQCLRPVGIAFDNQGRLFLSSDSTGEIYVVVKDQAVSTDTTTTTTTSASSPSSSASHAEKEKAHHAAGILIITSLVYLFVV